MTGSAPVPPTVHPFDPRSWLVTRRDRASWSLTVVLVLVGLSAVYGGVGLVRDGMGMPDDWLDTMPFGSWVFGGLALLATVAVPQLAAAWLVASGRRWGAVAGILAGATLLAWIGVQLVVLQRYFFLQPVVAGCGLAEIALAAWWAGRDGTA
ncbi:MAG: hypothetical protein ACKVZ6_02225 [Kineosporiaceae bacterium]|jgi:hypothetical protein